MKQHKTNKLNIPIEKKPAFYSLRRTLSWLKKYRVVLIVSMILGLISAAIYALIPLAASTLLEKINEMADEKTDISTTYEEVVKTGILVICAYLFALILQLTSIIINCIIGINTSKTTRNVLINKLDSLPLVYFDTHACGTVNDIIINNTQEIGVNTTLSMSNLINNTVQAITVFIGMIVISWQMSITSVVALFLAAVLITYFVKRGSNYNHVFWKSVGEMNGFIEESYVGLNIIKSFNLEDFYKNKFNQKNEHLTSFSKKSTIILGMNSIIMNFAINAVLVSLVCIVSLLAIKHDDHLILIYPSFVIFINFLSGPAGNITNNISEVQRQVANSNRVYGLHDQEGQKADIAKPRVFKKIVGNVEFKNVSFKYPDSKNLTIKDFSIKIKPGQKVAIVGPTGAGKTTIVNLLMRFYDVTNGKILIDGVDIKSIKRSNISSIFGMVLQDTWVFKDSIANNIIYNKKDFNREKLQNYCQLTNIDHFIKTLPNQYDTLIDNTTGVLSSGGKQLLTITRAIIQDSPIIILDEATSGIDTRLEAIVQNAIDKLQKNKTAFVIAHRLSTIRNADVILVMKDGNIIEHGDHNELINKNGFYAKLYNSQFNI